MIIPQFALQLDKLHRFEFNGEIIYTGIAANPNTSSSTYYYFKSFK